MNDDTSVHDSEQRSIEDLIAGLQSTDPGDQIRAHCDIQRQAISLARQVVALRAEVAAHEDADRRWSADMEELRRELQSERAFIDTLIADLDARSGEPL